MSGFFGLLRTDGVAVEPRFLDESAQCLHFRGPDGGQTWAKDGLGTCFSYLETGTRHQSRSQPVMSHVCMRAVSRSAATQYVSAAMPVMENRPRPRRWPCAGFPCWPKISWRSRKVAANFARSPVIRVCLWPESVRMQLTPVWEKRYLELDGQRAKYSQTKLPLGILYVFAPRSSEQDVPRIEKTQSPRSLAGAGAKHLHELGPQPGTARKRIR
jgi:hypothetical protein